MTRTAQKKFLGVGDVPLGLASMFKFWSLFYTLLFSFQLKISPVRFSNSMNHGGVYLSYKILGVNINYSRVFIRTPFSDARSFHFFPFYWNRAQRPAVVLLPRCLSNAESYIISFLTQSHLNETFLHGTTCRQTPPKNPLLLFHSPFLADHSLILLYINAAALTLGRSSQKPSRISSND